MSESVHMFSESIALQHNKLNLAIPSIPTTPSRIDNTMSITEGQQLISEKRTKN